MEPAGSQKPSIWTVWLPIRTWSKRKVNIPIKKGNVYYTAILTSQTQFSCPSLLQQVVLNRSNLWPGSCVPGLRSCSQPSIYDHLQGGRRGDAGLLVASFKKKSSIVVHFPQKNIFGCLNMLLNTSYSSVFTSSCRICSSFCTFFLARWAEESCVGC